MNNRIRFMILALRVIAALIILLMILLVVFTYRYMPSLERPEFIWKVAAIGVTLTIGAEIIAWALKKEKKWAWVMALILCCLNLFALLVSLAMVRVSGGAGIISFICKSGFIDCTEVEAVIDSCKSAKIDCGLEKVEKIETVRQQKQNFKIHVGDHVSPDKPEPGAGRIQVSGMLHQYQFTAPSNNRIAFRPEIPCMILGRAWLSGYSDQGAYPCVGFDELQVQKGVNYTIKIEGSTTGEYAFSLVELIHDVQDFTLNIGDHVVPDKPGLGAGRIETPGSRDRYTFSAEAGTRVEIQRVPPCAGKFGVSFLDPVSPKSIDKNGTLKLEVVSKREGMRYFPVSHSDFLECSEPKSMRTERTGTFMLIVDGMLGETGDYSFVLKLGREINENDISDKKNCSKPSHYDMLSSMSVSMKVTEIFDHPITNEQKVEKLVQVSTREEDIEGQAFQLCADNLRNYFSKKEYAKREEIISSWRKVSSAAPKPR